MSKMDNLRAMREARYEQGRAQAAQRAGATSAPKARATTPRSGSDATGTPEAAAEVEELCGHRSMNGRSCTREAGHAAKNHRYS